MALSKIESSSHLVELVLVSAGADGICLCAQVSKRWHEHGQAAAENICLSHLGESLGSLPPQRWVFVLGLLNAIYSRAEGDQTELRFLPDMSCVLTIHQYDFDPIEYYNEVTVTLVEGSYDLDTGVPRVTWEKHRTHFSSDGHSYNGWQDRSVGHADAAEWWNSLEFREIRAPLWRRKGDGLGRGRYAGLDNPPDGSGGYQLFCKTLTGKTLVVPTEPHCLIQDFKLKVTDMEGIPPEQQRLVHYRSGKELEDGRNFFDYNIINNETLCIILKLRGS